MKTLIAHRVHLNGDTKQSLQQSLIDVCHAIKEAQAELRDTAPNARNFYGCAQKREHGIPQGDDAGGGRRFERVHRRIGINLHSIRVDTAL